MGRANNNKLATNVSRTTALIEKMSPESFKEAAELYNKSLKEIGKEEVETQIIIRSTVKGDLTWVRDTDEMNYCFSTDYYKQAILPDLEESGLRAIKNKLYPPEPLDPDKPEFNLDGTPLIPTISSRYEYLDDSVKQSLNAELDRVIHGSSVESQLFKKEPTCQLKGIYHDSRQIHITFDEHGQLHSDNDYDPALDIKTDNQGRLPAVVAELPDFPGLGQYYAKHGEPYRTDDRPTLVMPFGTKVWLKRLVEEDSDFVQYSHEKVELNPNSKIIIEDGISVVETPDSSLNNFETDGDFYRLRSKQKYAIGSKDGQYQFSKEDNILIKVGGQYNK